MTPIPRNLRPYSAAKYRIRLSGYLDSSWSDMMEGMGVANEQVDDDGYVTTLEGTVKDQAALFGVLNLAYDLGLCLLLVQFEAAEPSV